MKDATAGRTGRAAWWLALASLVVWWGYDVLNLGLLADPDDLAPLVRDLDVLTVPLVTAPALLALGSVALAAETVRRAGAARRTGRVVSVLCGLLAVLGVVGLLASGFADPVPPIIIVPVGLALGIALLRHRDDVMRSTRRHTRTA